MKELIVLLPALNEAKSIGRVIKGVPITALRNLDVKTKIIVIDGHSTDKTREIAKSLGANVMLQKGKGKGAAFKTVLTELKNNPPDVMVMLDADNTYDPDEIPQMILPILLGKSDVVMGSREEKTHRTGNKLLSTAASLAFKHNIKDLCTGFWAFNEKAIRTLKIDADGFDLESDLFAKVNKAGLKLVGVPISYRRRIGVSKLKIKDAFVILGRIIRNVRDWNPLILFGGTGTISLITAFFYGLKVIEDYLQRGYVIAVSTAILTALLGITGFFLLAIGLILDFLERRM